MARVVRTPKSPDVFDPWLANRYWAETKLSFSFPENGTYYSYRSYGEVFALSSSQQDSVRRVLSDIAGFTGLSFAEQAPSNVSPAVLRFAAEKKLGGGYAYLPGAYPAAGDAYFGRRTADPDPGNAADIYFLHEIGHTMGLNHGHSYPVFARSAFNSQEYSVMTYTDYVGDKKTFSYDTGPVDWPQSYMQLDIAAMQFMYGANYADQGEVWSGDTVYTFDPDTGEMSINGVGTGAPAGNRIFRTIWDGNGTDTYDLSAYGTDLEINLAAGRWSTFSTTQLADLNRFSKNPDHIAVGNVANARLVNGDLRGLIENATGGIGSDVIAGNRVDNLLRGGGGADRLNGGSGDDTLRGGSGADRLVGGVGADILQGGAGADILTGGAGADTFLFARPGASPARRAGDTITDFTPGRDLIDLSRLATGTMSLSPDGTFSGLGPEVALRATGPDLRVLADTDGDGRAEFRLTVAGLSGLSEADFVL